MKISYEEFAKLDIRVGKVLKVEDHPNADKLYILQVDVGEESPRTIVAGLKAHCTPEHLEGRHAIFIINLEPATIRGIESNGMILAATNPSKTATCILTPDLQDLEPGSKIS